MLGRALALGLRESHTIMPLPHQDLDVTQAKEVLGAVDRYRPDVVIHTAAWTAVDECEKSPEKTFEINAEGTRHVAQACRMVDAGLVYLSTDYVFDGTKGEPYVESDSPNPVNVYGMSKLQGERAVAELVSRHWIVRTAWLFGPGGRNFVRTVLERARQTDSLHVVNDQRGCPTYTLHLAPRLAELAEKAAPGVYHVTNQGACTWYDLARETLRLAGETRTQVRAISSAAAGRPARRPSDSRLANSRLQAAGLALLPPWREALEAFIDLLLGESRRP